MAETTTARSIQGEQQDVATSTYIRASEDDVDLYVDRVTDEVIACRDGAGTCSRPSARPGSASPTSTATGCSSAG